jgi:hypothetical protein
MSKGANIFNHFNPPKSDGHKVVRHEQTGPQIYCPVKNDQIVGIYTSAGTKCTCGKIF